MTQSLSVRSSEPRVGDEGVNTHVEATLLTEQAAHGREGPPARLPLPRPVTASVLPGIFEPQETHL